MARVGYPFPGKMLMTYPWGDDSDIPGDRSIYMIEMLLGAQIQWITSRS